jgi:hypothetical protein
MTGHIEALEEEKEEEKVSGKKKRRKGVRNLLKRFQTPF